MANVHGLQRSDAGSRNPFARPPQANHIQAPPIDHQQVKEVKSEKELEAALKKAALRLTVVHFATGWYPPCFEMAAFLGRLSAKYPNVQFLRLDCEALPAVAGGDRYRVKSLPYLVFVKKQTIEDRLDDKASQERIEQTIMRLAGIRSTEGGQRLGSTPSVGGGGGGGGKEEKGLGGGEALLAMGFNEGQIRKGMKATGNNVEAAAAWLLDHPEVTGEEAPQVEAAPGQHVHQALCDRCKKQIIGIRYKCKSCRDFDLCGECYKKRIMWHDDEHEFAEHEKELVVPGAPGGPPKKELSEEEKKAEVRRLREVAEAKRKMREEDDARRQRELELKRRVEAKNTGDMKRKWEEQKVQMELDKAKREKEREEAYKQKLLEKIRREKGIKQGTIETDKPIPSAQPKKEITECTLQIRGSGGALTWTGPPNTTVGQVAEWVAQQRGGGPVTLVSTYPKVVFSGENANKTLVEAQLAPRGVLVIQ